MIPKRKAEELVSKYIDFVELDIRDSNSEKNNAKQCALIAVDEIIKSGCTLPTVRGYGDNEDATYFWQQVRTEIKNL